VMGVPGKLKRKLTDIEKDSIMTYGRNYIGYKDQYIEETGSDNK
jgi:hypothetical protein